MFRREEGGRQADMLESRPRHVVSTYCAYSTCTFNLRTAPCTDRQVHCTKMAKLPYTRRSQDVTWAAADADQGTKPLYRRTVPRNTLSIHHTQENFVRPVCTNSSRRRAERRRSINPQNWNHQPPTSTTTFNRSARAGALCVLLFILLVRVVTGWLPSPSKGQLHLLPLEASFSATWAMVNWEHLGSFKERTAASTGTSQPRFFKMDLLQRSSARNRLRCR